MYHIVVQTALSALFCGTFSPTQFQPPIACRIIGLKISSITRMVSLIVLAFPRQTSSEVRKARLIATETKKFSPRAPLSRLFSKTVSLAIHTDHVAEATTCPFPIGRAEFRNTAATTAIGHKPWPRPALILYTQFSGAFLPEAVADV